MPSIEQFLSGFRRFLDVVETEPEIVNAPDAEPLENVKGEVEYKNVSFHYSDDDTPVLDRVSFKIPAGRSIALVGPSGSGKTTICSLLPRFYDVTGGVITIDGQDVRKLTLESLRSQIGLVQQDVYLFCGSIRENIAYGKPGASMEEIIDAAKKANIHEFIMSLPDGYDSFVGERGTRLSGGQKQRLALAAVLAARARHRMKAVFLMGVMGYGVALTYELYGAPDLALTQVLSETITLVLFVLVLRRLPPYFSNRPLRRSRSWRLLLAVLSGVSVSIVAAMAAASRIHEPISLLFAEEGFVLAMDAISST